MKRFFSYNVLSDSYLICKEIKLISKPCLVHNLLMECLEKKKGITLDSLFEIKST